MKKIIWALLGLALALPILSFTFPSQELIYEVGSPRPNSDAVPPPLPPPTTSRPRSPLQSLSSGGGSITIPVLCVNFPDRLNAESQETIGSRFPAVEDYYWTASLETVRLVHAVCLGGDWQTVQNPSWYYLTNGRYGIPNGVRQLFLDAISSLDNQWFFEGRDLLSPYAVNGQIPFMAMVIAGRDASYGSGGDVWPFATMGGWTYRSPWSLVVVQNMFSVAEDETWNTPVATGVIAHEEGHAGWAFADMYPGPGNGILQNYSLMGLGNWGYGPGGWGMNPASIDPVNRASAGWTSSQAVTAPATISLGCYWSTGNAAVVPIDGITGTEQAIAVNYCAQGGDVNIPQGVGIYHVDASKPFGSGSVDSSITSTPPCQWNNHYRVALVQMDGRYDLELGYNRGDQGDLSPGSTGRKTLGPASLAPSIGSYKSCSSIFTLGISGTPGMTMTLDIIRTPPPTIRTYFFPIIRR